MRPCDQCQQPMTLEGLAYHCVSCGSVTLQTCPVIAQAFDPTSEYGWEYNYEGQYAKITSAELQWLRCEAEGYIPAPCYFEIRAKVPLNYGQDKRVAWYYSPDFANPNYVKYIGVPPPGVTSQLINGNAYLLAGFTSRVGGLRGANIGSLTHTMEKILTIEEQEGDCHCRHSWYDHIGWRQSSPTDKRVSCRIVGCGCECYTEDRTSIHRLEEF